MKALGKKIIDWQLQQEAQYPWIGAKNPYHILLSEFLLQQTRSDQALPYYLKFLEQFPTIQELALADAQRVLKLWEGLGYYRRARLLHACCNAILKDFDGQIPSTYNALIKLPGIGPYTAAAIASFAFAEEVAVVDGNVYRLFARLFALENVVPTAAAHRKFAEIGKQMMPAQQAAQFNQGIMNLGAQVCTPKQTKCDRCPLVKDCKAFEENRIMEFPIKKSTTQKTLRHFHYFLCLTTNRILLQQRTKKDVWENMYELPLIEQKTKPKKEALAKLLGGRNEHSKQILGLKKMHDTEAILSHQKIKMTFYIISGQINFTSNQKLEWIPIHALDQYPMPRSLRKFVSEYVLNNPDTGILVKNSC